MQAGPMRLNLLIALACGLLSGCTTTSLGRVTPGLLSTASIEKAMDGGLIGGASLQADEFSNIGAALANTVNPVTSTLT